MKSVPSSEAQALLSQKLICPDAPDWKPNKMQPGLFIMECGLVSEDGSRAGLHLVLQVKESAKTGLKTFKFTVFRHAFGAQQRVYQLDISPMAHAPKNWHDLAHEHMGTERIFGAPAWLAWGYPEALDYFSKRTNIAFVPPLADPFVFELKSS